MEKPDKRILEFLKKHHVMTLATSIENEPWCANCFYSFCEDEMEIVFTSDEKTKHIQDSLRNCKIAGSVVLETSIVGKIQGIQFIGKISESTSEFGSKAQVNYLKRFPFAVLTNTKLWIITLDVIKMTDNQLGFGKKIFWERGL